VIHSLALRACMAQNESFMNIDPQELIEQLQDNIRGVVLGKDDVVRLSIVALLAGEHVLLEDVPGVGKTLVGKAMARSLSGEFHRIQFTPDLLPGDITGSSLYNSRTQEFTFSRGPIFAHVVLADEINRATPRTQSALLEAMSERQVSVDGETHPLPQPFMVIATQNPYEFEGTYFLPENQLDRFMIRVRVGHPDRDTEREILRIQPARTRLEALRPVMTSEELLTLQDAVLQVEIEDAIVNYILDIAEATRRSEELTVGLSPRGSLALMQAARASALLERRNYVIPDDVKSLASAVCSHRLLARAFAHDGATSAAEPVFQKILETIPIPR